MKNVKDVKLENVKVNGKIVKEIEYVKLPAISGRR